MRPRRCSRSSRVTTGAPSARPSRSCSYHAAAPGPSAKTTTLGSATPSGAASRSAAPRSPKAWDTGRRSAGGGSSAASSSRAAAAYPSPEGIRTWSSRTRKRPSGPRTRSNPATPIQRRTAAPTIAGSRCGAPCRTRAGRYRVALAVGVTREALERPDALGDARGERLPLRGGEHPRHGVEREDAVVGGAKGHPALPQSPLQAPAELTELPRLELPKQLTVAGPRPPVGTEDLVVCGVSTLGRAATRAARSGRVAGSLAGRPWRPRPAPLGGGRPQGFA